MTRQGSPQALEVLQWLARLPFLGVDDLALLTGQPEPDIEGVLRETKQDGLVDSITPSSPELHGAPVHILSEPTRRRLTSTLGEAAARTLPLAWRDVVHSLARLEATVALNVFSAGLVASLHRLADREVADLRTLPVRRPQDAWWPPGVRGYGCIRATAGAAPLFVTVDRAGAPAAHRAALVAGWYRFRESSQPWGYDIPPILVLCPGRRWRPTGRERCSPLSGAAGCRPSPSPQHQRGDWGRGRPCNCLATGSRGRPCRTPGMAPGVAHGPSLPSFCGGARRAPVRSQ